MTIFTHFRTKSVIFRQLEWLDKDNIKRQPEMLAKLTSYLLAAEFLEIFNYSVSKQIALNLWIISHEFVENFTFNCN
jgi:hypothetical protein